MLIEKSFGVARYAWNLALTEWNGMYSTYKVSGNKLDKPSAYTIRNKFVKDIKPLKTWLSEVSKESYANAILDLGEAWNKYFKGITKGKPKYKTKKSNKNSFTMKSDSPNNLRHIQNRLYIPKFKKKNFIKCSEFPRFIGEVKVVTISKKGSKYFASCLYSIKSVPAQYKRYNKKVEIVGIDIGSRELFHTSDGYSRKIRKDKNIDNRIKRLQRKLRRQVYNSKNYLKTKTKLQDKYLERSNKKLDQVHKSTNFIVRRYKNIVIEDLNVSNMMKNTRLSKTISESYYYEFRRQLEYKIKYLIERGVSVELFSVDPRYTSKICSDCGQLNDPKSNKTYHCTHCGAVKDRDFNASINIARRKFPTY